MSHTGSQDRRARQIGYAAYLLLMLGIIALLWALSRRIDYEWDWQQVPQHLLSSSGQPVLAPFDAYVQVSADGRRIDLQEYGGERRQQVSDFAQAYAESGDLVFRDDLLAYRDGWRPGILLIGLWMTLKLSAVSLVFALLLGLLAGLGRVAQHPTASALAATYVELIRGTPLLVQMFIVYFFIGTVLQLSAFTAGVVALSVFTGAYVAEVIRGGIQSVSRG